MSSHIDHSVKSYISTADIAAYVLVKKDVANPANVVVLDTEATDIAVGITIAPAKAGKAVPVRFLNSGGTAFIKAAGPIAINAAVKQLNGGTVDDAGAGLPVGYAEEAATFAGDIIEIRLP